MDNMFKKGLLITATSVFFSGCAVQKSSVDFTETLDFPRPTRTVMTDYIGCFGDMLSEYRFASGNGRVEPLRIAVVSVKDQTAISTVQYPNSEIPNNFTDMALSIASKIGGPVRLVHIPKDEEIVTSYQYGATPGKKAPYFNNFSMSHYRADTIQIYGALTEYDRFIKNQRRTRDGSFEIGGGSGETEIDFSRFDDKNTARMTMDFYTSHGFVGDIVNHSSSTNTIKLYQQGQDRSYGLSIDGNSIGYASSSSLVDARHKAIRLLVEMGLIETLGKYEYVPYWKCMPNSNNTQFIKFKQLLGGHEVINFADMDKFVTAPDAPIIKNDKTYIDKRDRDLMMAVKANFEYAEYINEGIRQHAVRPIDDDMITISSNGQTHQVAFPNRKNLVEGMAKLFHKNIGYYVNMKVPQVIDDLHRKFIEQGVLDQYDDKYSANMYLALWLHAPVRKNSRWVY